jgi:hypothetical protein
MCNDCLDHYRHGSRAPDNYWSAATLLAFRRTYASRQGGARATSSKHINRPQNFPISVVFKIACTEVCLPYAALLAKHPPETSGHLTWQVRRRRKHSAGPRVEENIMKFHPAFFSNFGWLCRGGCALALAVSLPLGSGLAMAQEQVQSQQSQQQTHEQQAQQGQQVNSSRANSHLRFRSSSLRRRSRRRLRRPSPRLHHRTRTGRPFRRTKSRLIRIRLNRPIGRRCLLRKMAIGRQSRAIRCLGPRTVRMISTLRRLPNSRFPRERS